jgi:hypothetical protein
MKLLGEERHRDEQTDHGTEKATDEGRQDVYSGGGQAPCSSAANSKVDAAAPASAWRATTTSV